MALTSVGCKSLLKSSKDSDFQGIDSLVNSVLHKVKQSDKSTSDVPIIFLQTSSTHHCMVLSLYFVPKS